MREVTKLESLWLSNDECKSVVDEAWNERFVGTIHEYIEGYRKGLAEWAKRTFGVLKMKIKKAEKSFSKAQKYFLDACILQTCNGISNELDNLHHLEESY